MRSRRVNLRVLALLAAMALAQIGTSAQSRLTIDQFISPAYPFELVVHGDDDRNVAFAQTTGLVQLLRGHDVEHELFVFPDDVHDSLLYKGWLYTFNRTSEFIARYIGPGRRSTTTAPQ